MSVYTTNDLKPGMIKGPFYFIRNHSLTNRIIRNLIRIQIRFGKYLMVIATRFRIYGIVTLKLEGIEVRCLCKADDFMANGIYYGIDDEENELRLMKLLTTNAGSFVEVGSYTGIYSLVAAKCNPNIEILCIEPHPNNFKRILENIKLNELSNIRAVQLAAGREAGVIRFSMPKIEALSTVGSVNHAFSQAFHEAQHTEVEVEQKTLDQLLTGMDVGPETFIKIDVEYYELSVLKGAQETLRLKKPLVMIEIILSERLLYHKPAMKGKIDEDHAMQVEAYLKGFGYSPYQILKDGIYRVDSVINGPDTRNYLFAPKATSQRFVPFEQLVRFFFAR